MNEKNTISNNISCEYYVPLGKAGSLVIQAPVVLSRLKITLPFSTKINLSTTSLNVKTKQNKVFIKKPRLSSENKLILTGHIEKFLLYTYNDSENNSESKNTKIFNLYIPIEEQTTINFDQLPVNYEKNTEYYYEQGSEPINYNMESIQIVKDEIEYTDSGYINELTLCLQFSLTQLQYVFIPEPEGDVILLQPHSNKPVQNPSNDNFYYSIGYEHSTGLVANKTIVDNLP